MNFFKNNRYDNTNVNEIKRTREEFLSENERFFKGNIATELYFNNEVSIINLADSVYVITSYYKVNNHFVGFAFPQNQIMNIASDDKLFYQLYMLLDEKNRRSRCIIFDEKLYNKATALYQQTLKSGPNILINKELDAQLLEMKKQKTGGMMK